MKKISSKQAVAIIGVVLLVLLYLVTLLVAIFDSSASGRWFQICLVATMAVPLLIWIYVWIYGKLTNKKTMADLFNQPDTNTSTPDLNASTPDLNASVSDTSDLNSDSQE